MTSLWRHWTLFWLQLGFFVFPKYDRLSLIPSFCPVFVRQLSVLGNFDLGTSIITLIMGSLRTKNWNKKQKILKMLPRKYFRFIKNWHYGIIRFEIISVWKKIYPLNACPKLKASSDKKSQNRHQHHVELQWLHGCWWQMLETKCCHMLALRVLTIV